VDSNGTDHCHSSLLQQASQSSSSGLSHSALCPNLPHHLRSPHFGEFPILELKITPEKIDLTAPTKKTLSRKDRRRRLALAKK
jgi:hypothetical protein